MQSMCWVLTVLCVIASLSPNADAFPAMQGLQTASVGSRMQRAIVPSSGIIDYIGSTIRKDKSLPRWSTDETTFKPPTDGEMQSTRFKLFFQLPWKKIWGKVVLKAKISGSLPLASAPSGGVFGFGGKSDLEPVDSLQDFQNLLNYASVDPRVQAIVLEIGSLNCGYAKLTEARRMMKYFRQSGKKIIGYCSGGAEKELYFALGCDEFYIPPDGGLDLRGFSAAATFVRGVFDKIGIEPQVQRIGKYKSFGDTFNRTSISEAQREVVSSLLMEASDFWADSVGLVLNKTAAEVMQLWADEGIKTPYDYKRLGFVSGVKYLDQVEDMVRHQYKKEKPPAFWDVMMGKEEKEAVKSDTEEAKEVDYTLDYSLDTEFVNAPRRKSVDTRILPVEITDIVEKLKLNETAALNDFLLQETSSTQKELSALFNLCNKPIRRGNSTDYLEKISLLAKGKILFSKNLFALDPLGGKIALKKGVETVGNGNDDAIIRLNLNNFTETENIGYIYSNEKLNFAFEVSVAHYSTLLMQEKSRSEMVLRMKKRKDQVMQGTLYPAGLYLKKMKKGNRILSGLQYKEVRGGPRIVVINAVGGIGGGKSGNGVNGQSLGSDTLIAQVRQVRDNPRVKAVVIRVDSPGGSALASDLMWREIRALSKEKPVVASMVDVAASGGYYIAMACDEIVAEELTITGSIGVVSSKFNAKELNGKVGFGVDAISRGRYAEVLSTSRGFTEEEDTYFADSARKAYTSFITKAAASRNMTVEALNEVAQGRVWTGRQALQVGLVDHMGGLSKAIKVAASLANLPVQQEKTVDAMGYRVETLREQRGGLPFPFASSAIVSSPMGEMLAVADDSIACSGLVSSESLGINPIFKALGLNQLFAYNMAYTSFGDSFVKAISSFLGRSKIENVNLPGFLEDFFE